VESVRSTFVGTTESQLQLHNVPYNTTQTPRVYIHFLPVVVPHQGGSPETTRGSGRVWHVSFSGLISMIVFDILQIANGCIQICRRCIARTCIPLAADPQMIFSMTQPLLCRRLEANPALTTGFGLCMTHSRQF
jgi:hypothetical protein